MGTSWMKIAFEVHLEVFVYDRFVFKSPLAHELLIVLRQTLDKPPHGFYFLSPGGLGIHAHQVGESHADPSKLNGKMQLASDLQFTNWSIIGSNGCEANIQTSDREIFREIQNEFGDYRSDTGFLLLLF